MNNEKILEYNSRASNGYGSKMIKGLCLGHERQLSAQNELQANLLNSMKCSQQYVREKMYGIDLSVRKEKQAFEFSRKASEAIDRQNVESLKSRGAESMRQWYFDSVIFRTAK